MAHYSTYPITGIQYGLPDIEIPGRVPLRVEADEFFANDEYAIQRSLFLLAMVQFKAMPPDQKESYFQIAGIHSQPRGTWDDPNPINPNTEKAGYCAHSRVTFPTWHRPYVLLFEQRVYEIMLADVIPTFHCSQQEVLIAEAGKWRLPYWDWAAKKQRPGENKPIYDVPLILRDENVMVMSTIDLKVLIPIPNPMSQFTAPKNVAMGTLGIKHVQYNNDDPPKYIDFQKCTTTSKHPPGPNVDGDNINFKAWKDGAQDVNGITASLQNDAGGLKKVTAVDEGLELVGENTLGESVHRLLCLEYVTSYEKFATGKHEPKDNLRDALSLESIHNNLHNYIGGEWGHMGHVPVAAFDPIFWMHHANVDRLLAIYQALYDKDEEKSWWSGVGGPDELKPDAHLAPFHLDTKGTTYNSNDCRYITKLGYTYPELQRWGYSDGAEGNTKYIAYIAGKVHDLYAPPPRLVTARTDYIVNVIYEKFALGGVPFMVQILLHDKLVGSVYNFSAAQDGGCENCAQQERDNILCSGQVILTGALLASIADTGSTLTNLHNDKVEPYLKENFRWRVRIGGDTEIPLLKVPSLKVTVAFGGIKVGEVEDKAELSSPVPIKGGMKHVHCGDSSENECGNGPIHKPIVGPVKYDGIYIDKNGAVYDTIKVTPDKKEGGSVKTLALMGAREYEILF